MKNFFYFDKRSNDAELMDDFKSDKIQLYNTLKHFYFLNLFFTKSRTLINNYILKEIKKNSGKTYTFLDIGGGGGDIAFWLYNKCRKMGLNIKISILDYDKRIIDFLKDKLKRRNIKDIKIIHGSAFNLAESGKFDFIFANHFLHHFNEKEILKLIKIFVENTRQIFILNDLMRQKFIYFFHKFFARIFLRNSFAYTDGLISIKKGFIYEELLDFSGQISKKIAVKKLFPGRVYLYYKK